MPFHTTCQMDVMKFIVEDLKTNESTDLARYGLYSTVKCKKKKEEITYTTNQHNTSLKYEDIIERFLEIYPSEISDG